MVSRRRDREPESGFSTPAMILSAVDFPAPFLPTSPMRSPSVMLILAWSRITWCPYLTHKSVADAMETESGDDMLASVNSVSENKKDKQKVF